MKTFKLVCVLGLFAVMGVALLAEPQDGGAQGPPRLWTIPQLAHP